MILPLPRTSVPSSPTAPDPRDEDERPALILANLGTPAATHAQSRSVLPAGVPLRPPDRRDAPSPVATRPGRHHPAGAPSRIGGDVRHHLAPGEETSRSGSPLMHYGERQGELLQQELGESVQVRIAMRYGQPASASYCPSTPSPGPCTTPETPTVLSVSAPSSSSRADSTCPRDSPSSPSVRLRTRCPDRAGHHRHDRRARPRRLPPP